MRLTLLLPMSFTWFTFIRELRAMMELDTHTTLYAAR